MTRRAVMLGTFVGLGCSLGPLDVGESSGVTIGTEDARGPERDDTPPVLSDVVPPPIMGGGLLVTADGSLAIVSDPDRDSVHVVDLRQAVELHVIALEPRDLPFRAAEDAEGRVHVVVRGGGAVVTIDPESGEILARRAVCSEPRGIDATENGTALVVACASGELVTLGADDGSILGRDHIDDDLRDVVVLEDQPWISRFRAAKIGPASGDPIGPPVLVDRGEVGIGLEFGGLHPNTAWKTVATPGGRWVMVHQLSTDGVVEIVEGDDGEGPGDGGGSYAGGDEGDPCAGIVQTAITIGDRFGDTKSAVVGGALLSVDVAISPDEERVAIASQAGLAVISEASFSRDLEPGCDTDPERPPTGDDLVAVAFAPDGRLYAFSREPVALWRVDFDEDTTHPIPLTGPKRADTGHAIFHRDAGNGIACASCHPEGADDGRVWRFAPGGRRHTPALDVGLRGTEPFHWGGELATLGELLDEVHAHRMGAAIQAPPRIDAFARFLHAIPVPAPVRGPDEASARGEQLFTALGCATCHFGAAFTSNESVEIGADVPLQVPTLRAVSSHPPYMHDGRAADLVEAVWDMVSRTRPRAEPTAEEVEDLVAYLQTL